MIPQISSTVEQDDASRGQRRVPVPAGAGSLRRAALLLALGMIALLLLAGCGPNAQAAGLTPVRTDASAAGPAIVGSPSRSITDTIHPVEFRGIAEVAPGGTMTDTWTIGGRAVNVGPETDLKLQLGALEAGAYVQVIGRLQSDGSVDASKILVKKLNPGQGKPETGITNTLPLTDTLPGDEASGNRNWDVRLHGPVAGAAITTTTGLSYTLTVNGQLVIVDADTWVKAQREPVDGDWLQVKGLLQADGTILATSIQWVHRVPDQPGKSADRGQANGEAAGPGQGGITAAPPGKSGQVGPPEGKGGGSGQRGTPTGRPETKPGRGNANGHR